MREEAIERLLALDPRPLIRPHARHVISDVPGCLAFLRREPQLRLAFEPAALFEPEMIRTAEEHLERMFSAIAPLAEVVVLSDVQVAERDGEAWCMPVPVGEGVLPLEALLRLARPAGSRVHARTQREAEQLAESLS